MKKVLLFILLLIPILFVKAASTPRIITLESKVSKQTIKYNGTIEHGSHAVMCKLYNSKDELLDMLSSAVDDQKFEGSFEVAENGEYIIACANYEGGDIKTVDAAVLYYKVVLDVNGGTLISFNIPSEVEPGTIFEFIKVDSSMVKPPEGYVFEAYEIDSKRYEVGEKYTINSDTTIKILWKKVENTKNSKTFDAGITISLILLTISGIGIATYFVTKKKNKKASK